MPREKKGKTTTATAEVVGYTKKYVWVRVPEVWGHRILTLDREWLEHGYAQFDRLVVEVAPDSLTNELGGYLADLWIVEGIDDGETLDPE